MAGIFLSGIRNDLITLPKNNPGHTWHQFVIRTSRRDELKDYLSHHGIGSDIHYPIPPHLSSAYRHLGLGEGSFPLSEKYSKEILSLPMYAGMTEKDQKYIVKVLNEWV